jgi:hypothetical protein
MPWDDIDFVRAVDAVSERVIAEHPEVPPILAADLVERILREMGYANVAVTCDRTVEDVRSARATWVIRRDGRAAEPSRAAEPPRAAEPSRAAEQG